MENERNLTSTLAHIEASEEEMTEYRARLSARLSAQPSTMRWSFLWVPVAAMAILAVFLFLPDRPFGPESLDELQTWVAQNGDMTLLEQEAKKEMQSGKGRDQLNAMMVLCLTQEGEEAMNVAAQALTRESRPTFRAFYLEFLLDHADRYAFNPEFIETLMDGERDPICLKLMNGLLRMS